MFGDRERQKIERLEAQSQAAIRPEPLPSAAVLSAPGYKPAMVCLQLDSGKKQKIRPGDILGALTREDGVAGKEVGKIHIFDNCAYVAVRRHVADQALRTLTAGKLKGRSVRVRKIR